MIKVCHITDELKIGGLERIIIAIATNLKGYNHEIWCLKKGGPLAQEVKTRGIRVREFNFEGKSRIHSHFHLIGELKKERFDVIHCHGLYPSIWGRVAAVFAGVPAKINHCQNLYYDVPFNDRVKLKLLSFSTDKFIAVSSAVKKSLVEAIGINANKIEVIYNGSKFHGNIGPHERKTTRAGLGIKDDDFVIGNISRLEEHKGHAYLLDTLVKLKNVISALKCVIVGDGPAMKMLKQKCERLGLRDIVIFSGFRSDIETMLSIMDIFILPSLVREGLPLALVEAASMALPLIATDIGGNGEIVFNEVNGFIVKPKDTEELSRKIAHLITNRLARKNMGEESKEIWERHFTLENMLEKIDKVYHDALAPAVNHFGKNEQIHKHHNPKL
ncbi:MAG: hypothetical protein A2987_05805 [Omnitrophica bacterium RIFCSPLOWO2_01_FULL_45_10]|nr:MAG: hypothetical protein A2987_05805 [Omnitrophica bacterium RIFCSPLOWO2_01_FULL_45_10]